MAVKAPSKTLYTVDQGFWHQGLYVPTGNEIALTDAQAKNLVTGGNVSLPKPAVAPEAAAAPEVVAPVQA
jgi:hypothetical protein